MIKTLAVVFLALCTQWSFASELSNGAPKIITFVCEHGVAKSVIAAQHFNKLAREKGINYVAVSRGVKSESVLHPATSTGLKNDGFDTSSFTPSSLSTTDSDASELVVLIGVEQPPTFLNKRKVTNWVGVPSVGKDYAVARDDMLARIGQLISTLPK